MLPELWNLNWVDISLIIVDQLSFFRPIVLILDFLLIKECLFQLEAVFADRQVNPLLLLVILEFTGQLVEVIEGVNVVAADDRLQGNVANILSEIWLHLVDFVSTIKDQLVSCTFLLNC